ncbi:nucleoredoxin-like [Physella acuta]|uniref:nucleoredoxin-like n=1 Tax=Physella acuta TaxID=109671 RepID=UPI0027DE6F0C|nr:nucleoredoxin-like [Physella acuta]
MMSWLEEILGTELLRPDKTVVQVSSLVDHDVIGLYFSADWCPPCGKFTPTLMHCYQQVRGRGKRWEIIFISLDKDEESCLAYHSTMPWLMLPFHSPLREPMPNKYSLIGIPVLLLLDPKTGGLISDTGRALVTQDQDGVNFPWQKKDYADKTRPSCLLCFHLSTRHQSAVLATVRCLLDLGSVLEYLKMALVKLLGDKVVGKNGQVDVSSLSDNDVVGFYFSAHWCPPCRGFTPVLAEYYTKLRNAGKKFEVVFVSSDSDEASCQEYFNSMPWLLLPYEERDTKDELSNTYEVSGIPTLVLLDAKTGDIISTDGDEIILSDTDGDKFPWK